MPMDRRQGVPRQSATLEEPAQEVERLSLSVGRRRIVEQTRMKGQKPLTVETIGDISRFSASTATIAAGASETVYLTYNREVGGENVFANTPDVQVLLDETGTPGGTPHASAPPDPAKDFTLMTDTLVTARVKWLAANKVWAVQVTNDDTEAHNYIVRARGT